MGTRGGVLTLSPTGNVTLDLGVTDPLSAEGVSGAMFGLLQSLQGLLGACTNTAALTTSSTSRAKRGLLGWITGGKAASDPPPAPPAPPAPAAALGSCPSPPPQLTSTSEVFAVQRTHRVPASATRDSIPRSLDPIVAPDAPLLPPPPAAWALSLPRPKSSPQDNGAGKGGLTLATEASLKPEYSTFTVDTWEGDAMQIVESTCCTSSAEDDKAWHLEDVGSSSGSPPEESPAEREQQPPELQTPPPPPRTPQDAYLLTDRPPLCLQPPTPDQFSASGSPAMDSPWTPSYYDGKEPRTAPAPARRCMVRLYGSPRESTAIFRSPQALPNSGAMCLMSSGVKGKAERVSPEKAAAQELAMAASYQPPRRNLLWRATHKVRKRTTAWSELLIGSCLPRGISPSPRPRRAQWAATHV